MLQFFQVIAVAYETGFLCIPYSIHFFKWYFRKLFIESNYNWCFYCDELKELKVPNQLQPISERSTHNAGVSQQQVRHHGADLDTIDRWLFGFRPFFGLIIRGVGGLDARKDQDKLGPATDDHRQGGSLIGLFLLPVTPPPYFKISQKNGPNSKRYLSIFYRTAACSGILCLSLV